MSGIYKRKTDLNRKGGKYTLWWFDAHGKPRSRVGTTDRASSTEIARKLESDAAKVRAGLIQPAELTRRDARGKPIEAHIKDYRLTLEAKGDTKKHAQHIANAVMRLLVDASVKSVDVASDRVQEALGRLKARRSARTANHALAACKGVPLLMAVADAGRIEEVPRGIAKLKPYPEKSDRKRVRRALTLPELAKLLDAAHPRARRSISRRQGRGGGRPIELDDRARTGDLAYPGSRWRQGSGREIPHAGPRGRSASRVTSRRSRSGPATRSAASGRAGTTFSRSARTLPADLAPFLDAYLPGVPVLSVPEKTATMMLRGDLRAAGVPYARRRQGGCRRFSRG